MLLIKKICLIDFFEDGSIKSRIYIEGKKRLYDKNGNFKEVRTFFDKEGIAIFDSDE